MTSNSQKSPCTLELESKRWENYRLANNNFPNARKVELDRFYDTIAPKSGETILELGTGNGYNALRLAQAIGSTGKLIAADFQCVNIDSLLQRAKGYTNISTLIGNDAYTLPLTPGSVDKIASIAALHHYDNRSQKTGTSGREKLLASCYRLLKPDGTLILSDVAHGTAPQRYFDAIDNPTHCSPSGHPHDFVTIQQLMVMLTNVGFRHITGKVEDTPWHIKTEEEGAKFIHQVHNAACTPEESWKVVKQYLPVTKDKTGVYVGWELFYVTAKK